MVPPNGERWFHTLVVVGASLGGCGGKTVMEHAPPTAPAMADASGSAGSGGGGSATPDACAFAAQFVCDDYLTKTNCRCDLEAPIDDSACASPFDYSCVELPCQLPSNQICVRATYVGCHCDPAALRPADCQTPEQFFCDQVSPFLAGCACRSPAVDPTSCGHGYCCQSDNPRFGCECCATPIR